MSLSDRINDTSAAPWVIEEIFELEARLEVAEQRPAETNPPEGTDDISEHARLINKPSWDIVPKHLEWTAQDSDGRWYGYRNRPRAARNSWLGDEPNILSMGETPAGHDWRETLEQRPAETSPSGDTVDIPTNWDGETWPPPVGTRCLARNPYTEDGRLEKATVIHQSSKGAIVVEYDHGDVAILSAPGEFHPIRTTEQKAIEALANALEQYGIIPNPDNSVRAVVSRAIYDAIRDGKIPGVKLEGEV